MDAGVVEHSMISKEITSKIESCGRYSLGENGTGRRQGKSNTMNGLSSRHTSATSTSNFYLFFLLLESTLSSFSIIFLLPSSFSILPGCLPSFPLQRPAHLHGLWKFANIYAQSLTLIRIPGVFSSKLNGTEWSRQTISISPKKPQTQLLRAKLIIFMDSAAFIYSNMLAFTLSLKFIKYRSNNT